MIERRTLGVAGGALALAALGGRPRPAAAQQAPQGEPVKFGALIGLTGPSAVAGNNSYRCMQIAVAEVNSAGGVLGRAVRLVVQDDEGRPKAAVDAANLLSDVQKVPVAVGGYPAARRCRPAKCLTRKRWSGSPTRQPTS